MLLDNRPTNNPRRARSLVSSIPVWGFVAPRQGNKWRIYRRIQPQRPRESSCELPSIPVKFNCSGILLNGTLFGLRFASAGAPDQNGRA